MNAIIFLIENVAPALYIFSGVIIFFALIGVVRSRRELGIAEFALERELGQRRRAGSITRMLFALEVILAVYAVANVVAPTIRADLLDVGAAGQPLAPGVAIEPVDFRTLVPGQVTQVNSAGTPINQAQVNAPFETLTARPPEGAVGVIATATGRPTLPGTVIPGVAAPIGCEPPKAGSTLDAYIDLPLNGQVLYEAVTVRGVANAPNFARYKFEISGPSTGGNFAPFGGDKTQPVKEVGLLGQLSLLPFDVGQYLFKLAVFDATDQLRASCTITVFLRRYAPTTVPTLTPQPSAPPTKKP